MSRPPKCRWICTLPTTEGLTPYDKHGPRQGPSIVLRIDEYEVIRLMDLQSLTQEQCAQHMGVSRATIAGIYAAARRKLAQSLVHGRPLLIDGGEILLCNQYGDICGRGQPRQCVRRSAKHHTPKGEPTT